MSTATTGKKRKNYHRSNRKNPKRGSPAILLTCETGRESKCRREGLEILDYYWKRLYKSPDSDDDKAPKQSLDEELASLKTKAGANETPFVDFDTGCRGTVLCLTRDAFERSNEATKQSPETKSGPESDSVNESAVDDSSPSKKQKLDDTPAARAPDATLEAPSTETTRKPASWDPLELIQSIFQDIRNPPRGDYTIPSSRFVTRLIPMQATCFASANDLKTTVQNLLESHFESLSDKESKKDVTTFAIHSKRRNCGHLTRDDIIKAVGEKVSETTRELASTEWKVNLKKPDYTIWVEVCMSLCGVSIVPSESLALAPNFNMAECVAKNSNKNSDDP